MQKFNVLYMTSRSNVMLALASLDLGKYVATLTLPWESLDWSTQVKLQWRILKMVYDDRVITEVKHVFGSLLYDVYKVFG